jgi:Rrf2 family transcriptional regulator, iron-sulfur cluster assembly transcription factor
MHISSKGRFALNAMIDLALRQGTGPVALATIGARQQVSMSYLEQLFSRLRQQGLVHSTRGPGGGYTLGRPAQEISAADIVLAVDETLTATPSQAQPAEDEGLSSELWQRLGEVVVAHMATVTLSSLVDEQVAKGVCIQDKAPRRPVLRLAPPVKVVRTLAPNSVFAFGRSFA